VETIMKEAPIIQAVAKRRDFLRAVATAAGFAFAGEAAGTAEPLAAAMRRGEHEEAEVTPGEDLMQEHGVLERILLLYDEAAHRIESSQQFDPSVIMRAAGIIRRFVEDYHEKLEEELVFPRLQKARRETDLVAILLRQHQRGREVTDDILRRDGASVVPELAQLLRGFVRMYRPHAAREDTVLFPAFRDVMGRAGYRELGERFEDREHRLFGAHGFESTVAEVARLEAILAIDDLANFTAR
jgi:hemerythrin-like domain-containing protein